MWSQSQKPQTKMMCVRSRSHPPTFIRRADTMAEPFIPSCSLPRSQGPSLQQGSSSLISGRFSSVNDPCPARRERFILTSAPEMVSAPSRSGPRDAGEKRRTAARHDREAAAQESDRAELTHDETGVAEHVTCSDDPADRHRTPRAARLAQASVHSRGNSRCTEPAISPDAVPVSPRPRCPMKRALVLPVCLGLLAAACGNSSAGEAARTDATRLASSASPGLHRRPNHAPIPSFSS